MTTEITLLTLGINFELFAVVVDLSLIGRAAAGGVN